MADDTLNPNFEWKKKNIGKKERLSRRIDSNQALLFEKKKKNDFSQSLSVVANSSPNNGNINLLRKRLKEALDDDYDEDDEWIFDALNSFNFEIDFGANALFQQNENIATNQNKQQQTLQEIKMQQDAAKIAALNAVNALAKKNGLDPLSSYEIAENMQNNGWEKETFKMALENNLAPEIKNSSQKTLHPNDEKIIKLVKGLKRLKKIGAVSEAQGMEMNDIIKITDEKFDDKKVAEMLLKKTGRLQSSNKKVTQKKKKHSTKISFKNLLKSRTEDTPMKA